MAKKIKVLAPIVVALLLLAALVPTAALAADETGATEGSVGVGNAAPVINSVVLTYGDGTGPTPSDTLTPFQTATTPVGYKLAVTVTDGNKLTDIDTINVYVHYDANNNDDKADVGTQDTNTEAKMTWTPSTFSMAAPGSTTWPSTGEWAIDATSSFTPTLTSANGEWLFYFQISKVATEESTAANGWDVYVEVDDGTTQTWDDTSEIDYKMAAYREIGVTPTGLSFGTGLTPPSTDNDGDSDVSANTIANNTHKVQIYADATWGDAPSVTLQTTARPAAAGTIILWADADETQASLSPDNDPTTTQVTTSAGDLETGLLIRQSPGGTIVYSTLWLDLGTGIEAATYDGTITYKIQ